MTLLRYQTDGGTEKEIVVTEGEIDRNFTDQNMARVFVKRDRIDEANITRGQTEMYVVDDESVASNNARFGGLLREFEDGPHVAVWHTSGGWAGRDLNPRLPV